MGGGGMTLRRLVLTFKPDGLEVRTLYRSKGGPNPGTKARRREVAQLARTGLVEALEAIEGDVEDLGTSGFEVREDVLHLPTASPSTAKLVKGA
jgi:hypothetical protein